MGQESAIDKADQFAAGWLYEVKERGFHAISSLFFSTKFEKLHILLIQVVNVSF